MIVLREVSVFLKKEMFLCFFQLLGGELSYFGDESPTDCKNAFFLSRRTWSRRLFLFWKIIYNLVFSFKKREEPFKKFITMNFWQKISARLSQLDSTLPEGLFADFFSRKRINCKNVFATWADVRYVLSKKIGRFVKSASLRPDEFVGGKYVFYGEIMVYKCFSVGERKNVGLWQKKSTTLSGLPFYLSK